MSLKFVNRLGYYGIHSLECLWNKVQREFLRCGVVRPGVMVIAFSDREHEKWFFSRLNKFASITGKPSITAVDVWTVHNIDGDDGAKRFILARNSASLATLFASVWPTLKAGMPLLVTEVDESLAPYGDYQAALWYWTKDVVHLPQDNLHSKCLDVLTERRTLVSQGHRALWSHDFADRAFAGNSAFLYFEDESEEEAYFRALCQRLTALHEKDGLVIFEGRSAQAAECQLRRWPSPDVLGAIGNIEWHLSGCMLCDEWSGTVVFRDPPSPAAALFVAGYVSYCTDYLLIVTETDGKSGGRGYLL